MNKRYYIKRLLIILLFPLGLVLFYTTPQFPLFIEKAYSKGLFKILSQILSTITGVLPFSMAEIGLYLFSLLALFCIGYVFFRLVTQKRDKHLILVRFSLTLAAVLSIAYFFFMLLWGFNYNRLPFSQIAGLNIQPSSVKDLYEVCEKLINQANDLRSLVDENQNGVMYIKNGYREAFKRADKGFHKASELYPELGGNYGKPKGVLLSKYMSYTGISGVYCPYTAEANVDIDMPDILILSTACHEMAHQRGFAREDEANYISYLTCKMHPDNDYKYSGTILALIHSMNALYKYDKESFSQLHKKYSPGIVRDFYDNSQYWKRFEGPVERATDSLNNAYLKANRQKDGVQSYGRMVDLLIAEHKMQKNK
ncbi:MAG: DUF3810 domain-containing protein [Clostridia bacterium]|nr:DUF3810 domain-containing protein [Clostridia bacterium]